MLLKARDIRAESDMVRPQTATRGNRANYLLILDSPGRKRRIGLERAAVTECVEAIARQIAAIVAPERKPFVDIPWLETGWRSIEMPAHTLRRAASRQTLKPRRLTPRLYGAEDTALVQLCGEHVGRGRVTAWPPVSQCDLYDPQGSRERSVIS
jgi:hypothetical protein